MVGNERDILWHDLDIFSLEVIIVESKIPKLMMDKLHKCHKYHTKADNIQFEFFNWLESKGYDLDSYYDFYVGFRDMQSYGFSEEDVMELISKLDRE